jgi:hypothetical protein
MAFNTQVTKWALCGYQHPIGCISGCKRLCCTHLSRPPRLAVSRHSPKAQNTCPHSAGIGCILTVTMSVPLGSRASSIGGPPSEKTVRLPTTSNLEPDLSSIVARPQDRWQVLIHGITVTARHRPAADHPASRVVKNSSSMADLNRNSAYPQGCCLRLSTEHVVARLFDVRADWPGSSW